MIVMPTTLQERFNTEPRHIEALVALAMLWPLLLFEASIVIWEFTLAARPH